MTDTPAEGAPDTPEAELLADAPNAPGAPGAADTPAAPAPQLRRAETAPKRGRLSIPRTTGGLTTGRPSAAPPRISIAAQRRARRWLDGTGQAILTAAIATVGFLLLVAALVVVQSRQDETRQADAAIILPDETGSANLDQAIALFRAGAVSHIVLAAADDEPEAIAAARHQYLTDRGIAPETIAEEARGASLNATIAAAADRARGVGASQVLLVADPLRQLRALKIARDAGLQVYASPPTTRSVARTLTDDILTIGSEMGAYVRYILLRG